MSNNLIIYVIYDLKAKTIARVFLFKNMEVCLRFLKQNIEQLGVNLEDYELYEVGEIDEEKLNINPPYLQRKNMEELTIEDYYNQNCAKEFRGIKNEFFEKIKKEEENAKNQIPNTRNPFTQKIK